MNDHVLVHSLSNLSRRDLLTQLHALGDEAAGHVHAVLSQAVQSFKNIHVLTHVPPFREACWHEGALSDDDWAPHFTCKAVGDALLDIARRHPHCRFEVFCGHTHSPGRAQLAPNLIVHTGSAEYGLPAVQSVFEVP